MSTHKYLHISNSQLNLLNILGSVAMFDTFNREQNLDIFYSKIFAGNEKFAPSWKVVKMILILSHGNAAVESGFSVNKELLVENMEEDTIVAQRVVFDAIRVAGMAVTKVDISNKTTIASLQQQKKQKLAELKAEAAAIDSKIASIIESGKDWH